MDRDDDLNEGPDERDADLGWGGPEFPIEPTFWQRTRQVIIAALILLVLVAIILPLVLTARR